MREREVELKKELEIARIGLELEKEERETMKLYAVMLKKDHLSPEDKERKRYIIEIVFEI